MNVEELKKRDYLLLVDKSSSMGEKDLPGGLSRWQGAEELTLGFTRKVLEFDADGITVIPFAGTFKQYDNVMTDDIVKQIFRENEPNGSTATHLVLEKVFNDYFKEKKKPITVLCVTDGAPTDPEATARVIVEATKKMDQDDQIAVSFLQIGKDASASAFLRRLDDDLEKQGAKFDIVDAKTSDELENMTMVEALVAAIND